MLQAQADPYDKESYTRVTRKASADSVEGRLTAALQELLKGATPQEKDQGLISVFSNDSAGKLNGVVVTQGNAVIDFRNLRQAIPQAGTSEGGAVMMIQLNQTVFGFPSVKSVEYRVDGSCDSFWEWQESMCHVVTRDEWESGKNALTDDE